MEDERVIMLDALEPEEDRSSGGLPPVNVKVLVIAAVVVIVTVAITFINGSDLTDSATWAKVFDTAKGVIFSIGASAILFVGANKLFDLPSTRFALFSAAVGALFGFVVFLMLWGNRLLEHPAWMTVVGTVIGAVTGYVMALAGNISTRLLAGVVGCVVEGAVITVALVDAALPSIDYAALAVWLAVSLAVGLAIWAIRGAMRRPSHELVRILALWGSIGWLLGTFGAGELGSGSVAEAAVGLLVGLAAFGVFLGYRPLSTAVARTRMSERSRSYIFLFPALGFVAATLVIPLIRTLYLSLFKVNLGPALADEFVGLRNYGNIFTDPGIVDVSGWRNIFTSAMFIWAMALLVVGFASAAVLRRRINRGAGIAVRRSEEVTISVAIGIAVLIAALAAVRAVFKSWVWDVYPDDAPSFLGSDWGRTVAILSGILFIVTVVLLVQWLGARSRGENTELGGFGAGGISLAVFLVAFAVFAALRGTVFNNLWWVFTVSVLATGLGLAIAVLADRGRFENAAKSLIFLPMAISFVGAGIIWRFVYIARPPDRPQTGMLNYVWVRLGQLSHSGWPRAIVVAIVALIAAWLLYVAWRAYERQVYTVAGGMLLLALPLLWFGYRLIGPGIGGFEVVNGEVVPQTILFLQQPPFNNFWLMVVLIWIQTGFAMVIFSAAIKAVPSDLIEAAKVDGAVESQVFWRVTVPQIAPTIGVVVTTLIVLVMKVFDIVKVMTNGNFDTQVLANEMWQRAFTELNFGLGSALAILLFVAVLPIMYMNIRRMQKTVIR